FGRTFSYDAANRQTQVQFGGTGLTPLRMDTTRNARGLVTAETRYSDLAGTTTVGTSTYAWDAADRQTGLTHKDGSTNGLTQATYAYDAANRVTTETVDGTTTSFSYDAADQLTAAGTDNYSYDASGNRNMTGYSIGTNNRLLNDGTWTYSYDAEMNRTKKSKGASAETWTYGYDERNQMVWAEQRATDGGTLLARWEFTYDDAGEKVRTDKWTSATGTVTYKTAWVDGQAFADMDGSGNLTNRYVNVAQDEGPRARISGGGTAAWLLKDRLGSVRLVTDGSGAAKDRIAYNGFGKITSESGAHWGGGFKYTGQEAEDGTGMQRHHWRWYDLETGQWTTEDVKGFSAGDFNLKRYVGNSPTNRTDPSGLLWNPLDTFAKGAKRLKAGLSRA